MPTVLCFKAMSSADQGSLPSVKHNTSCTSSTRIQEDDEAASTTSTALDKFAIDDYYDDFSIESAAAEEEKETCKRDGQNSEVSVPEYIALHGTPSPKTNSWSRSKRLHIFCKATPKIELHAHLNGSIRESTLVDLARERGVQLSPKLHAPAQQLDHAGDTEQNRNRHIAESHMYNTKPRNLLECFEIFEEIPKCVNDLKALQRITREALEDFANENVAYLELRSGPKCLLFDSLSSEHTEVCTKRRYVESIVDIMKEFEKKENDRYQEEKTGIGFCRLPLIPRLLISVDRSGTLDQALENISLAVELFQSGNLYVVGVELGGNPTRNDFCLFEPAFKIARDAGLRVAIHCGEVSCATENSNQDPSYNENMAILDFRPDRLGHALLLPDTIMEKLLNDPIPVECCPTSNVMTLELALHHGGSLVDGMQMHPQLNKWLMREYPISINTDDPGLFCTNSTREILLVAKACHVGEQVLARIILDSIEHIFEPSNHIRERLARRIERRISNVLSSLLVES